MIDTKLYIIVFLLSASPLFSQTDSTNTKTTKWHLSLYGGWSRGFSNYAKDIGKSEYFSNGFTRDADMNEIGLMLDQNFVISELGINLSRVIKKNKVYVRDFVRIGFSRPLSMRYTTIGIIYAEDLTEEKLEWYEFDYEEYPISSAIYNYDTGYGIELSAGQSRSVLTMQSKSGKRGMCIEGIYGISLYYIPQKALKVEYENSFETDLAIITSVKSYQKRTSPLAVNATCGIAFQLQKNGFDGLRLELLYSQGFVKVYETQVNITNKHGEHEGKLINKASNFRVLISYPFLLKG